MVADFGSQVCGSSRLLMGPRRDHLMMKSRVLLTGRDGMQGEVAVLRGKVSAPLGPGEVAGLPEGEGVSAPVTVSEFGSGSGSGFA